MAQLGKQLVCKLEPYSYVTLVTIYSESEKMKKKYKNTIVNEFKKDYALKVNIEYSIHIELTFSKNRRTIKLICRTTLEDKHVHEFLQKLSPDSD